MLFCLETSGVSESFNICSFFLDEKRTKKSCQNQEIAKALFVFGITCLKLCFASPFLLSLFLNFDVSDFVEISSYNYILLPTVTTNFFTPEYSLYN